MNIRQIYILKEITKPESPALFLFEKIKMLMAERFRVSESTISKDILKLKSLNFVNKNYSFRSMACYVHIKEDGINYLRSNWKDHYSELIETGWEIIDDI